VEAWLRFNQPVNQTIGRITVLAPDGTEVHDGNVDIDGERVRQLLNPLPAAGTYTVEWRVVAADGHPLTGRFRFTYDGPVPAGDAEPTPESEAPPSEPQEPSESDAAPETRSESAHQATEAASQAAAGDRPGQAAATGASETPVALLEATAAVLLGFVVASAYAVRALARRRPS
jgi:hypothetical protein